MGKNLMKVEYMYFGLVMVYRLESRKRTEDLLGHFCKMGEGSQT